MGIGPAFKNKYAVMEPFQNVELFNLLCAVLNLSKCAPNNGTYGAIFDVLKAPPPMPPSLKPPPVPFGVCPQGTSNFRICTGCQVCW